MAEQNIASAVAFKVKVSGSEIEDAVEMLRNIVSPIIVQATFIFAYAMLAEAGLTFLGVGVDPSTPTWGTMISEVNEYVIFFSTTQYSTFS